jgi:hypothetical protein
MINLLSTGLPFFCSRSLVRACVFSGRTTKESRFDTRQEELNFHVYKIIQTGSASRGAVLFKSTRGSSTMAKEEGGGEVRMAGV